MPTDGGINVKQAGKALKANVVTACGDRSPYEVNPRNGDEVTNIDQLLLRSAIGYQLTNTLSLWQGYGRVGNFNQPHTPSQPAFFNENRFFLGADKTFTQYLNIGIGYQNQMFNNRSLDGKANLINHILLVQFYINL